MSTQIGGSASSAALKAAKISQRMRQKSLVIFNFAGKRASHGQLSSRFVTSIHDNPISQSSARDELLKDHLKRPALYTIVRQLYAVNFRFMATVVDFELRPRSAPRACSAGICKRRPIVVSSASVITQWLERCMNETQQTERKGKHRNLQS